MLESVNLIFSEARNQRFSCLSKLSSEDVVNIWNAVSKFVESQMQIRKGVYIPNLGTFSFTLIKLDIGNNKQVVSQRPVFLLSEKFSQLHDLKYTKHHTTGEIVISLLNYTALALRTQLDRDIVESCVREMLQSLSRAVANSQNVDFLFHGVGILSIKNEKVKMKFFKEFVNSLDNSGNALKTMENRPHTADSVMTTRSSLSATQRPGTRTLTLPKLNGGRDILPPISENENADCEEKPVLPQSRIPNRELVRPHTVEGVSSDQLFPPATANEKEDELSKTSLTKKLTCEGNSPDKGEKSESTKDDENEASLKPPRPPASLSGRRRSSRLYSSPEIPIKHDHPHSRELCHLCRYRSIRNIPVSLEEEMRRKQEEEDALLMHYQQSKDEEAMLLEEAKKNAIRQDNEKIAAFNLGVAEVVNEAKKLKTKEFARSYVFSHRPLTPLRFFKQQQYNKALENQVKFRRSFDNREKFDQLFQERLEQVQLAEDLAAQRDQFVRAKAEHVSKYREALAAQIRGKHLPLPKYESDSSAPIFGRYDMNNLKLLEEREKSRTVMKEHMESVSEKKKKLIIDQLTKCKEENEVLKKNKEELMKERRQDLNRILNERRLLEKCWKEHHLSKMEKDERARLEDKDTGLLLLQKMEQFKRCGQCQKSLNNCGESNLWSESRFIPGSRIMV